MNKLIIVHYINVTGLDPLDVREYMDVVRSQFDLGRRVIAYWVPIYGETRIECINPKLITEEEYTRVQTLLDTQAKLVLDFINQLSNDNKNAD